MRTESIALLESLNNLNEKINKDNVEINDKIRKSLRSKSEARKNEPEFKKSGIQVDYSPRQGTTLRGANGKYLYDDKNNIYGPTRPGFNRTHSKANNFSANQAKDYSRRADRLEQKVKDLEGMERDDIIRKYNDKSTDDALDAHNKNIEQTKADLEYDRNKAIKYRKDAEMENRYAKRDRRNGHDYIDSYNNRQIYKNDAEEWSSDPRRRTPTVDKVDYYNYLTKPSARDDFGTIPTGNRDNKLVKDYKELKSDLDRAKSNADYDRRWSRVKSDEELEKEIQRMRDELENQIANLKASNDKNKAGDAKNQESIKYYQDKINDYMKQIRANRAKREKKQESEETNLKESFIYKNTEDGSTINLNVTDDIVKTSVGDILDDDAYGKIVGLIRVNYTVYLITKKEDVLNAYSLETEFPFTFKHDHDDEFDM